MHGRARGLTWRVRKMSTEDQRECRAREDRTDLETQTQAISTSQPTNVITQPRKGIWRWVIGNASIVAHLGSISFNLIVSWPRCWIVSQVLKSFILSPFFFTVNIYFRSIMHVEFSSVPLSRQRHPLDIFLFWVYSFWLHIPRSCLFTIRFVVTGTEFPPFQWKFNTGVEMCNVQLKTFECRWSHYDRVVWLSRFYSLLQIPLGIRRLKAKGKWILIASAKVNWLEISARNLRFDLKERAILIRRLERKGRESWSIASI
jgi:hypothetical protein